MVTIREIAGGIGLLLSGSGDLDLKEIYDSRDGVEVRFPHIRSWYFAIADFSAIGQLTVNTADFDRLLQQDLHFAQFTRPNLAVAIVARSELSFGMARMWQSSLDTCGWQTMVFRDRASADVWVRHHLKEAFGVELPPVHLESGINDGTTIAS